MGESLIKSKDGKTKKEVSKSDFKSYEQVRSSGITNMRDVKRVESLSGLDRSTILDIMWQYRELMKKYPEVRKG